MAAQPDLAAAAAELVVDLRERASWRSIRNPRDRDTYLPCVVESVCGQYTITWADERLLDGAPQRYVAFRRNWEPDPRGGPPRRANPTVIGGCESAEAARRLCAQHLEALS